MKRRKHLRNSSQNKFIDFYQTLRLIRIVIFCRTVKDWNALPSEIVVKSADQFK